MRTPFRKQYYSTRSGIGVRGENQAGLPVGCGAG